VGRAPTRQRWQEPEAHPERAAVVRPRAGLTDALFWEPAHWIMQTRQLTNPKRRAEGGPRRAR